MTPEEQTLYRKASIGLALVTVLFAGFAWMTAQVEGFNATVAALAITSVASGVTALWLTFRWKVATVLVVTLAILAGGVIGARTEDRHEALACDRSQPQCLIFWAYYYAKVDLWFQRDRQYRNCLIATNFLNGPTIYQCYAWYYPGPFPRPPA